MNNSYRFEKDVQLVGEALGKSLSEIAEEARIAERSLLHSFKEGNPSKDILEAFYAYAYRKGLRLNKAKEEMYREILHDGEILLFHGSSIGIKGLLPDGSRPDCDFSSGFYCGEGYSSALCFVEADPDSSIYAFKANLEGLRTLELHSDLEWMLSICHNRGTIGKYGQSRIILDIVDKLKGHDLIIAPIADNRMFRVMQEFAKGQITDTEAIHALSASRLGKQYVFKTEKGLSRLKEVERMYLSFPEKENSRSLSEERAREIRTKLDLAKREFRGKGRYIEEIFG